MDLQTSTPASTLHLSPSIPLQRDASITPGWSWSVGVVLLFVVLITVLVKKGKARGTLSSFLRRESEQRVVSIRESRAVSKRAAVHVVEFEGKRLLIGESQAGLVTLSEVSIASDPLKSTQL